MAKLYILCGIPFAGKSTVADALVEKFDLARITLDEAVEEDRQKSYDAYHDGIVGNLSNGRSVITDTVAHKRASRDDLRKLAKENNAETVLLYLATPTDVAKERWLKNRQTQQRHDVGDDVFYDLVSNFEVPEKDENPVVITPEMSTEDVYKKLG